MAATPRSNTRNNSNTPDGSSVAATRKRTTAILSNTGTHTCMHALGDRKKERQADTEREREKRGKQLHTLPLKLKKKKEEKKRSNRT